MAKQPGRTMLVKIGDGGGSEVFSTLCGLNAKTMTLNNNSYDVTTADATTPGGQVWQQVMTGIRSVAVSGNGFFEDSAAELAARVIAMGTGQSDTDEAIANFQIIVPDLGTFQGAFHVDSIEYGGPLEGGVSYSIALKSAGIIAFTAA